MSRVAVVLPSLYTRNLGLHEASFSGEYAMRFTYSRISWLTAFTVALPLFLAGAEEAAPSERVPAPVMSHLGAAWLERPTRDEEERPEIFIEAMNLKNGDVVADIGVGSGYHARKIAPRIAPGGKVLAVDIQPEMLDILTGLAAREGISNIETVLGTVSDPMLPEGVADWVLLVDTYHEFAEPQAMLAKIRNALKPTGKVCLVEYRLLGDTARHIKEEHRMSVEQVLAEWEPAGFVLESLSEDLPTQHLFIFRMDGEKQSTAPHVILDTDFRSDVDDAGALAMLNALADHGECEIIGVMASQTGPQVVAGIHAINTWYGRGDVPIGLSPVDDQRFTDHYVPVIGDTAHFPSSQTNDTAPDSTTLYRKLLHAAPDKGVKIIVIGGQTCVGRLLDSEADHEKDGSINRTGHELITAKVSGLYLMAGNFADPEHPEHNINLDIEASQKIAAKWPTPIVYSGFEIGRDVITGGAMQEPEINPVAKAYELFPAGGVGTIAGSSSYDQTMVYYAIRGRHAGDTPLWTLSEPGEVRFPEARTVFSPNPAGTRRYLIADAPFDVVAEAIEALMIQPPAARTSTKPTAE
jgi:predicted methyltransferase